MVDGHRVTWLASGFEGAPPEETIDGIRVIRRYSIHTIYFFAWYWYRQFRKTHSVDVIIDEAGGIPLLSPLFEKKIPLYFFIHHIGEDEYRAAFPFPLSILLMRFAYWAFSLYKTHPTITVSDSTKRELIDCFHFQKVYTIENASNITPISAIDFSLKNDTIVFLGRLVPIKRVEDAIRAFRRLHATHPSYVLQIIGNPQDQYYAQSLKYLVQHEGLEGVVQFIPYMQNQVAALLSRAKIMLVTSKKEGF